MTVPAPFPCHSFLFRRTGLLRWANPIESFRNDKRSKRRLNQGLLRTSLVAFVNASVPLSLSFPAARYVMRGVAGRSHPSSRWFSLTLLCLAAFASVSSLRLLVCARAHPELRCPGSLLHLPPTEKRRFPRLRGVRDDGEKHRRMASHERSYQEFEYRETVLFFLNFVYRGTDERKRIEERDIRRLWQYLSLS